MTPERELDAEVAKKVFGWIPCEQAVLKWTISGLMNVWSARFMARAAVLI